MLEPRVLLAGDTYLLNFQSAGAPVPTRYLPDTGQVFDVRPSGQSYGWSSDHQDQARDRDMVAEQRLDTLIHFEAGQFWEFQLANGVYAVTVAVGDPANNDGLHTINVEGVNYWTALPDGIGNATMTKQITVSDGRITVNQGAAADKATRINYVHIVGLTNGPNPAPAVPMILEPLTNGQIVNHQDVHMEAIGFSDSNGHAHKSTDWEIWTVSVGAQPVWQTLGIEGVERLHTHLGDGIFINSHAATGLLPDTDYQLRVRFRDDGGAVSSYATRNFRTGPAATVFPLELSDVAASGVSWQSTADAVLLTPAIPNQPSLRLESADGELLLAIAANNGVTNTVTNPAELADHAFVRVVIQAGSALLNLPQSDLAFLDDHGLQHTILLPEIDLLAGQRLDLWVSSLGGTYFGSAAQTEPDFANLARGFDAPAPYLALKPGFVIEEVAGGLQLPVNIAFVPNPGPNSTDPYFYVTELYGAIKVVTRDFAVHSYASGLLNFDPTGNFPGSGEQGLAGIVVDPLTGDVFATRVWDTSAANGSAEPHHPQVIRFTSTDGGLTAAGPPTVLLDMVGENMGQSHQISNITIGPDGKLYVHLGEGFDAARALDLNSFRGKILRLNLNGTAPSDNPFYNAGNGISATDYIFAYGFRNPFGGAWRAADGKHYEVENGPGANDRLAQVNRGASYGWNGSDASMLTNALYTWTVPHAPVNITYVQRETFNGSQFPASMMDHAFVSESGSTLAIGPQVNGKRIVEFVQTLSGAVSDGPDALIEYAGDGAGSVVGLIAGPDGLYFTALYNDDAKSQSPADIALAIGPGAKVYRIRYVNSLAGDYNIDGTVDDLDYAVWRSTIGSSYLLAADGNGDGAVNTADYVVWRRNQGTTLSLAPALATSVESPITSQDTITELTTGASIKSATVGSDGANDLAIASFFAERGSIFAEKPRTIASRLSVVQLIDDDLLMVLTAASKRSEDEPGSATLSTTSPSDNTEFGFYTVLDELDGELSHGFSDLVQQKHVGRPH